MKKYKIVLLVVAVVALVWLFGLFPSGQLGGLVESRNVYFRAGIRGGPSATQIIDSSGVWKGAVSGTTGAFSTSLGVGGGTAIAAILSNTTTWNPDSLANNGTTTKDVTLANSTVGSPCVVGLSSATSSGAYFLGCVISANGTSTVTLLNVSGGTLDLANGTLRVTTFKY
ncbi:MAG: hypothetical protein FJW69_07450 [Actinobacteria bacterium]|nr:hypothetical protein [Actinomycetota bacterium]